MSAAVVAATPSAADTADTDVVPGLGQSEGRFSASSADSSQAGTAGNLNDSCAKLRAQRHGKMRSVMMALGGASSEDVPQLAQGTSFIRVERGAAKSTEVLTVRERIGKFLNRDATEGFLGLVIFANFVLICVDTDSRATEWDGELKAPSDDASGVAPLWVEVATATIFGIFCCELALRTFAAGRFRFTFFNCLDSFIIVSGMVEYVMQAVGLAAMGSSVIRVMRLCRLLRLIRVMRLFHILKELRKLLLLMGSCTKTLFWSLLLLVFIMTIWATISVELLNPIVQGLAESGTWPDCDRCPRCFSSVMWANITLFQTIVAGDSWGKVAIPVIETVPMTAIIFLGAQMSLVFGILNLIIAVIVDTFAEARSRDVSEQALDMDAQEVEEKTALLGIFQQIDADKSGSVTSDELHAGARTVPEFSQWLRVLDVDARDFTDLFDVVDSDNSGDITAEEFVEGMYRLKNTDPKTATRFVKHIIGKVQKLSENLEEQMKQMGPQSEGATHWPRDNPNSSILCVGSCDLAEAGGVVRCDDVVGRDMRPSYDSGVGATGAGDMRPSYECGAGAAGAVDLESKRDPKLASVTTGSHGGLDLGVEAGDRHQEKDRMGNRAVGPQEFQDRLSWQAETMQQLLETAIARATEVVLQAALQSANTTAKSVISGVAASGSSKWTGRQQENWGASPSVLSGSDRSPRVSSQSRLTQQSDGFRQPAADSIASLPKEDQGVCSLAPSGADPPASLAADVAVLGPPAARATGAGGRGPKGMPSQKPLLDRANGAAIGCVFASDGCVAGGASQDMHGDHI